MCDDFAETPPNSAPSSPSNRLHFRPTRHFALRASNRGALVVVRLSRTSGGGRCASCLIEDNQRLADYLGTALQNGGFAIDHVTTTVDAESALSAIHYDTILLDLGLPDMDGLVWLGHQRRRQMTRPVLVLTARDSLEDLVGRPQSGRRRLFAQALRARRADRPRSRSVAKAPGRGASASSSLPAT